jgi:hypothetical protein
MGNMGVTYGIPGPSGVVQVPPFQAPTLTRLSGVNQPVGVSYARQQIQMVPSQVSYISTPVPIQPVVQLQNVTVPLNETPIHYTPHNWLW